MAKEKTEKQDLSSKDVLSSLMAVNKDFHFNTEPEIDYTVSSGSLNLDLYLDGGFGPGVHRFCGVTEGGKTSEALEVVKNFLATIPDSKGVLIKAEGRLTPKMRLRSGIKFVFDAKDWDIGTCFVLETNIYETAVDFMRGLVMYKSKEKYIFVVDSLDGLIKKDDLAKGSEDANKVAGGAVIGSDFLKRVNLALTKRGHLGIFLSQIRDNIKIDPYAKTSPKIINGSGGNAFNHYANYILEFQPRFNGDMILPNDKAPVSPTNQAEGHNCKVVIRKSSNEKTLMNLTYPIKYGRIGGSIWSEKEVVDLLFSWGYMLRKGSWLSPTQDLKDLLTKQGFTIFETIQGEDKLFQYLMDNKPVLDYLLKMFKEQIQDTNSKE